MVASYGKWQIFLHICSIVIENSLYLLLVWQLQLSELCCLYVPMEGDFSWLVAIDVGKKRSIVYAIWIAGNLSLHAHCKPTVD